MAGFISAYVEGCDKCQRYGKDIHPKAQIQPQEVPEGPWQLVGVDLIGPLPLSKGKDMILNVVDHYTKQIHLFPVTSQITADGVASIYFEQVFPIHGIPKKIIRARPAQSRARNVVARDLCRATCRFLSHPAIKIYCCVPERKFCRIRSSLDCDRLCD